MFAQHKSLIAVIFLVLTSLFAMKALFHPGFYTSHDGWHQVARLYHFDQAVRSWQIPPRYSFNLLNGYGYPLFTFSYHMPWIIAEPLLISGFSIFDAIKIVFVIGFVVSGLTMFYWQREIWGTWGALVGSFLYLWAPYRFSNIFVRASLGEATSLIFLPLLFFSFKKLSKKRGSMFLFFGAFGLIGIILSHTMMLFLIFPLTFFYLTYSFYQTKDRYVFAKRFAFLLGVGALIVAYYLLPALIYKNLTIFQEVQRLFFQQQFLSLKDLVYSPWGYSASFTGVGQMSLQLGITQWVTVLLAMFVLISFFSQKKNNYVNKYFWYGAVFILGFICSLFLTLEISKPLWKWIGAYVTVDYPWRFLSILTFASSSLAGFVIFKFKGISRYLVGIFLICLSVYANRNHVRVNQYTDVPLTLYIASERTTNTFDEYLPKWANRHLVTQESRNPVETSDKTTISDFTQLVDEISFTAYSTENSNIRINSIYFPGMQLLIDKKLYTFDYKGDGFINFHLPKGEHRVNLILTETGLEKLANGLTISGLFILFLAVYRQLVRPKNLNKISKKI